MLPVKAANGINVDCEYDRDEGYAKRSKKDGKTHGERPDIIMHVRGLAAQNRESSSNFLVVEIKKIQPDQNPDDFSLDKEKLEDWYKHFYYHLAAQILVGIPSTVNASDLPPTRIRFLARETNTVEKWSGWTQV
jgi:hypothetical protein